MKKSWEDCINEAVKKMAELEAKKLEALAMDALIYGNIPIKVGPTLKDNEWYVLTASDDNEWTKAYEDAGVVLPKGETIQDKWRKEGKCPECGADGYFDKSLHLICPIHGSYTDKKE